MHSPLAGEDLITILLATASSNRTDLLARHLDRLRWQLADTSTVVRTRLWITEPMREGDDWIGVYLIATVPDPLNPD